MDVTTPLTKVVGKKTAHALEKSLDLVTVGDLLSHFPRRYVARGEYTDLNELVVGEHATVVAQVQRVNTRPMRHRRGSLLEVIVGAPGRRGLTLTFFNQPWRARELTPGVWGLFAGKVADFRGSRQLNNPEYQLFPGDSDTVDSDSLVEEFAGKLIPVYPATGQVPSWAVARCLRVVFDMLTDIPDVVPESIRSRCDFPPANVAFRNIHRPDSREALDAARRRLAYEEAFLLQVVLAQRRAKARETPATPRLPRSGGILDDFDAALPFALTAGQKTVGETIAAELADTMPMHRLLQGEVGSGKTVVAVRAMLQVVDAGGQAVMLAPTEVLATQHAHSITEMLGAALREGELDAPDNATRMAVVLGSHTAAARRAAREQIASGQAGIVVGTHALFSDGVEFADLGLVVVDEQHRFGVEQRDALRVKAGDTPPHTLVMTATPIPRTVAMTVFGDLAVSTLDELPAGRSPITTTVVPVAEKPAWMRRVWERVREEVQAGRQAYVVFGRIGGESGDDQEEDDGAGFDDAVTVDSTETQEEEKRPSPTALLDVAPGMADGPLSGLRTAILHGRLLSDEKEAAMADFSSGKTDVLFATTIVEVGVNVPSATMMVIVDADRFGVSQLHQLRGRVGRGSDPGLCLLLTSAPDGTPARQRLDAVASTLDGFRLAELDLKQRREGDVLGASQSGRRSQLKLLSLLDDEELIAQAREDAVDVVESDPQLEAYPELAAAINASVGVERAEFLERG